jgi:hypothetical protein
MRNGIEFKFRLLKLGCSENYSERARLDYVAKELARVEYCKRTNQRNSIGYEP